MQDVLGTLLEVLEDPEKTDKLRKALKEWQTNDTPGMD